jgi:hypothetical protein
MSRVIIGTYRGRTHIPTCIASMERHLKGVSDVVLVNDSPNPADGAWLAQYGKVIEIGGRGYTVAMSAVCRAAEGKEAFILEEDFEFLTDVHIDQMHEILYHRPYLAQVVLLRGPHFANEHTHGGLIEALEAKGHRFFDVNGVIEHTACFSMNPSLVRGEVWAAGWPQHGRFTEELKGNDLRQQGYRFGYLPGVRVAHHGERVGTGY